MPLTIESGFKKRLIVLLPESLAGKAELARAVHQLALQNGADVLYLTLVNDDEKKLTAARAMATMKALTADNRLDANSRLVTSHEWLKLLRETYRVGDLVVCHAEQTVRDGVFSTRPVSEFLQETLSIPVITLAGYYRPRNEHIKALLNNLLVWVGFFVILTAFTWLELRLDSTIHGAIHTILLVLLVTVEFGAVLAWNNLFHK
jgi:hypothetical protein